MSNENTEENSRPEPQFEDEAEGVFLDDKIDIVEHKLTETVSQEMTLQVAEQVTTESVPQPDAQLRATSPDSSQQGLYYRLKSKPFRLDFGAV